MKTITNQQIIDAGKRAYEAKRLTAQHPDRQKRLCIYNIGRYYHCVIGAALAEQGVEVPDRYNAGFAVSTLEAAVCRFENLDFALDLQTLHDAWAESARSTGLGSKRTREKEKNFREALYA